MLSEQLENDLMDIQAMLPPYMEPSFERIKKELKCRPGLSNNSLMETLNRWNKHTVEEKINQESRRTYAKCRKEIMDHLTLYAMEKPNENQN